jgi:hypothetical protein
MNVERSKNLFFCFTKRQLKVMGAGIALGGVAGYLYWKFIGCTSGSCPITSNKLTSMLYGAAMGFLLTASGCSEGKSKSSSDQAVTSAETKIDSNE